jgi:hypothetical protein
MPATIRLKSSALTFSGTGFPAPKKVCHNGYAVKDGNFQWVQFPPGDGSLQPEAIGAVMEVTKLLKYSDVTGHFR